MILVQIAWIVILLLDVSARHQFFSAAIRMIAILLAFYVVTRWSNPSMKLSWVFFITAVPIIGVPVYLIFGRPGLTRATRRRMDAVNVQIEPYLSNDLQVSEELHAHHPQAAMQSDYIWRAAHYPAYTHTDNCYYKCGEEMFEAMLADIRQAERYIFLEYFIIHEGKMWNSILEILEQKVKEGVDVRLIYDDMGCVTTLPHRYYKKLQAKGIKCAAFNPVRPILNIVLNPMLCLVFSYFSSGFPSPTIKNISLL